MLSVLSKLGITRANFDIFQLSHAAVVNNKLIAIDDDAAKEGRIIVQKHLDLCYPEEFRYFFRLLSVDIRRD